MHNIKNFSIITPQQIIINKMEEIANDYIKEYLSPFPDDLMITKIYQDIKPNIIDINNIMFTRRSEFIVLVNYAIKYSVYKFIIVTIYLDTRARVYGSDIDKYI
jgi:hypothetical protein